KLRRPLRSLTCASHVKSRRHSTSCNPSWGRREAMNIYARSASSAWLLLSLTGVPATHSVEYCVYPEAKSVLIIPDQNESFEADG
ncbi:MAG TPA: hypothetical protein VIB79_16230, partial [Candidatus Binatia bacterium]